MNRPQFYILRSALGSAGGSTARASRPPWRREPESSTFTTYIYNIDGFWMEKPKKYIYILLCVSVFVCTRLDRLYSDI